MERLTTITASILTLMALTISGNAAAERHVFASAGTACQPKNGHTDFEYKSGGEIYNTSTTTARNFTCPIDNLYDGGGTADWYIGGAEFAAVRVYNNNSSDTVDVQAYCKSFAGSWNWTTWNTTSTTGTPVTLGVDHCAFTDNDAVGIQVVLPGSSGNARIYSYYAEYQD